MLPDSCHSPAALPLPRPATFPSHHRTAFGAVAALLAGALQRAEQGGASYAHVNLLLPQGAQQGQQEAVRQPVKQEAPPQGPQQARQQDAPAAQQAQQQPLPAEQGERRQQTAQAREAPPAQQEQQAAPAQRQQQLPPALHPVQQPVLLFEDDGPGLSAQQLRHNMGIPSRVHASSTAVPPGMSSGTQRGGDGGDSAASHGTRWTDLQHAALRLGCTALLLTKRQGQGTSAGLLICAAAAGVGAEVTAAAVDWAADGSRQVAGVPASGGAAAPAAADSAATPAAAAWQAALDTICSRWPGGASEAWLQQQLATMPDQGTRLLVAQLRSSGNGNGGSSSSAGAAQSQLELDWAADSADLQQAVPGERGGAAVQGVPLELSLQGGTGYARCSALLSAMHPTASMAYAAGFLQ